MRYEVDAAGNVQAEPLPFTAALAVHDVHEASRYLCGTKASPGSWLTRRVNPMLELVARNTPAGR
jgi:hypothetical protein